jgi:glycosyltransferase involved in cell wall biosynthesis
MRIALLAAGGLHPSGREEIIPALLALVERLARRHDVHAFVLRHLPSPRTYPLAGATVHDLGSPRGLFRQWRAALRSLRAHGPFDLVHGYWADPAGLLAACAGRRLVIPSVVTCDSGEFVSRPEIGYGLQRSVRGRAIVAASCRLATCVHVTSRHMQNLARSHGIRAVRAALGIDVERFAPPESRLDGPPWRLLQVAHLNAVKDQATLLRAIAIVRRTHDVRLDLVGEDTLQGRLARVAADLGIAGAVAFHGFAAHADLLRVYHAAHIYVQSSLHEAAGVSVLEAAASGLPIVGTRTGLLSDWEGEAARAVPPGDAGALARAIVDLLENAAERQRLSEAARRVALRYRVDRTTRRIEAMYRCVCARRTHGRTHG